MVTTFESHSNPLLPTDFEGIPFTSGWGNFKGCVVTCCNFLRVMILSKSPLEIPEKNGQNDKHTYTSGVLFVVQAVQFRFHEVRPNAR